jgi:hypothetical protein
MKFNPFAENKIPSVSMFSKKFPEKKSIVASLEEVDTLDEKHGIKEYLGEKMDYEARKFFEELAVQSGENEARDFLPSSGGFSIISEEGELVRLSCSGLSINFLPALPSGIKEIDCQKTSITTLPELPEGLEWLHCPNNAKLSILPKLPESLMKFNCGNSLVATLPELPQNLQILYIHKTAIEALPNIPDSLLTLSCTDSPLAKDTVYLNQLGHDKPLIKITA